MGDGIASQPTPVPWFRRVTFFSVLAGLCPLIPVPFLDDRVLDSVRRRMTRALARERGIELSARQVVYLSGTYREPRGCAERAGGLVLKLTVKLIGKLFKKVLIFLAVAEAADVASRTFHEGYLLHLLFDPATPPTWRSDDEASAWRARWALEQTVSEADPRPVKQAVSRAFGGSRSVLREAARTLGRRARRDEGAATPSGAPPEGEVAAAEAEEERLLSGMLDPLAADLWRERGYLDQIEARFRHWHRNAETAEQPPTDPPIPT